MTPGMLGVTNLRFTIAVALILAGTVPCPSQTAADLRLPGQALAPGLFGLREIDLHLHSGMERPVDLDAWIDLAVADGRKVILLLDHLELYRKNPEEYETWRSKGKFHARYPVGTEGHKADFAQCGLTSDINRS